MQQKLKISHICGLTVLYSLLFFCILLAFPKKSGYKETPEPFSSAPVANLDSLPVKILRGSNTTTNSTPTATNGQTQAQNQQNQLTQSSQSDQKKNILAATIKTTCSDVGLCEKIRFLDGFTTTQKVQYYNAIIQIVGGLTRVLPTNNKLSDILFSITISPSAGDTEQGGERRGRGGSQTIELFTKDMGSLQEFREVTTHEIGHIVDLGFIKGTSNTKNTDFTVTSKAQFSIDDPSLEFYKISRESSSTRLSSASYVDFVGGYAMTSPYEDFAESFNMFLRHNDIFKTMAQSSPALLKKYQYMQDLLQGFSFAKDTNLNTKINQNAQRRPWDSTRMSIE